MLQLTAPRLLVSLSIVALAACGAHKPATPVAELHAPPSASAVAVDPPSGAGLTSAAPAAAAKGPTLPELPKAIELPGKHACSWKTSAFRATVGGPGSELRLREGGPVFARVDSGTVAIAVPEGKAGVALIEASSQGVFVSGIADAASITMYPAKPFVMEGLVVPDGGARLSLTAAKSDGVGLKLALPDDVVVPKGALEETRPCGDVGASPSTFDSMAAVFGARAGSHLLMSGGLAELSLQPDGARAATLRIPTGGEYVHAFDEQHGRTLIGRQTSIGLVFGWVRSARLQHSSLTPFGGLSSGFGRAGAQPIPTVATVRCEHDLPLIGEADGEARTVGRILAGTTVRIASWGEPRSRVVVDTADIREQHGTFSARTAELRACRDIAPKR